MSFERKSTGNTARRILADSANAKHRFGFHGEPGSPIVLAPKLSDLWYIEFNTVTNGGLTVTEDISSLAKSVSPISIQMSNMPVDQYGKRVYVPTRVDFPEVNITMYDTVDGKMFGVAESIYNKFFKNQDAKVSGANAEAVLTSAHEHGRKIPEGKHEYYHQHFEKITIYHFFGNLDGPGLGAPPSSLPRNAGAGTLQKIELINPLVTNITFSSSDYSASELRTTDLSIQPENIIIGQVNEDVSFPKWMTEGMEYMQFKLSPQLKRKEGNLYPDPLFGDDEHERKLKYSGLEKEEIERLVKEEKLRIDEQEYQDTSRKLSELMTLYNAQIQNPNEQGNAALEAALKERIGVIDVARSNRFSKNAKHPKNQFDTPYEATYKNPDIPGFGGIGDSNPPKNIFPKYTTDIGDALVQELIGSFFGKRKFDTGNIKQAFTNKMIEATGFPMNTAIDGRRIIDGAKGSAQGAYQTTEKALKPVTAENTPVFKTNSTDFHPGVSQVIKDKFK
tara:strand:+ start:38 stop:1552 length:1515 start_codon:yes stop_codon:yes gene_type:complete